MRMGPARTLLLAFAAFAAACADEPTAPSDIEEVPSPLLAKSGAQDDVPSLTSNGVPYRNPDYKHATGRSGGASLTARALKNMDGSTDLEVTTGDLGSEGPHDITKLQVKYLPEEDGDAEWTENYRVSSGWATYTYGGDLTRHADLQVQGNVRVPNASGKGQRTGVVTIQERINLRPDLAVELAGPDTVYVKTSGLYVASIAEVNGDVGATANCVFYVNGDEAARAQGIWIAEGDQVSCPLDYPFFEVGTYEVSVAVEDVDPGDWDSSNNTASMTVEVVKPIYKFSGHASASEDHRRYYCSLCTGVYRYEDHMTRASFYGLADAALEFPTSLSVTQTSGGYAQDAINLSNWGTSGTGVTCNTVFNGKSLVRVCTDPSSEQTWVNVTRDGGVVTYWTRYNHTHSYNHLHSYWHLHWFWWWYYYHEHFYNHTHYYNHVHYSYTSNTTGGGFQALGSDYTFDVRLEDAEGTIFESDPVVVPLSPYTWHFGNWQGWGKTGWTLFGS